MEDKKRIKKDFRVDFIRLSKIEMPNFDYDLDEKIVPFSKNNNLPKELLKLYNNVGLHRAIIQKKSHMFNAEGITFDAEEGEKQSEDTQEFLNTVNPFYSMTELLNRVGQDYFLFGGSYLQIIWSTDGESIKEIYHMPFQAMRSGQLNKYGIATKFYYNNNTSKIKKWNKYIDADDVIEFNAFSTKKNKSKPQILFLKKYNPDSAVYPIPDYIGAIKDLDTLAAISDFHNNNIHNNMQPGFTVFYKSSNISEEEQDEIVTQIKKKYTDTENVGKPMIFFIDGEDDMEIKPMETSDIADMYKNLSTDVKDNIVNSHQVLRAAVGLATPGSLGNTKEIIEAQEMMKNSYIIPTQNEVLEYINSVLNINNLKPISFINKPISLLRYNLNELAQFLTQDEMREYLGYEKIDNDIVKEDVNK